MSLIGKKVLDERTLSFTEENVDQAISLTESFCKENGVPERDALRIRLQVDIALTEWMECADHFPNGFVIRFERSFGNNMICLETVGPRLDPFLKNEEDDFLNRVNESFNRIPVFSYFREKNLLTYKLPKTGMSSTQKVLIGILVGLVLGFLGKQFFSESFRAGTTAYLLDNVCNIYYNLINLCAGPMVFLSCLNGILSNTSVGEFGKIWKKTSRYIFLGSCIAIFTSIFVNLFNYPFQFSGSSGHQAVDFNGILELIMDFFPHNIFDPFISGNTIQIIFLSVCIGLILLAENQSIREIPVLIRELYQIVITALGLIASLIPYLIAVMLVRLIWTDTLNSLFNAWKLVLVIMIGVLITAVLFAICAGIKSGLNPFMILKKSLAVGVIGFTTASSSACFDTMLKTAEQDFHVEESSAKVLVPLVMTFFKCGAIMYYASLVVFLSDLFGIPFTLNTIIKMLLFCPLFAIITPPIPGGSLSVYAMIISIFGFSSDTMSLVLALDVPADFICTGNSMFHNTILLAFEGKKEI